MSSIIIVITTTGVICIVGQPSIAAGRGRRSVATGRHRREQRGRVDAGAGREMSHVILCYGM